MHDSRIYVTVSSETSVLYEIDFSLARMDEAALEYARVIEIAMNDKLEDDSVYRLVTMTVDHERPDVLMWETTGISAINGRTIHPS